jgi:hypothetical protein
MKPLLRTAAGFGALAMLSAAGMAQTPPPTPSPSASATQEQQVTIVGCVEREADYRRAQEAGRGGAAGTGMGTGNEFVLSNAAPATAGAPKSEAEAPTGTAGVSRTGTAYELTGPNEGQVGKFVGQRVEISGKLKPAEAGAAGPTGGPTAGTPPSGVDVTSKDLKLRELEVTSVRATSGTCPAK